MHLMMENSSSQPFLHPISVLECEGCEEVWMGVKRYVLEEKFELHLCELDRGIESQRRK